MDQIILDFENWSVQEYDQFRIATLSGDSETASVLLAKLITGWDNPGNPSDPKSFKTLSLPDIGRVIRRVNELANQMLQSQNVPDGYEFDLVWNYEEFTDYTKAVSSMEYPRMFELLQMVFKSWPLKEELSVSALEHLSFEHYCNLNAAVSKAVKEAMQGN